MFSRFYFIGGKCRLGNACPIPFVADPAPASLAQGLTKGQKTKTKTWEESRTVEDKVFALRIVFTFVEGTYHSHYKDDARYNSAYKMSHAQSSLN